MQSAAYASASDSSRTSAEGRRKWTGGVVSSCSVPSGRSAVGAVTTQKHPADGERISLRFFDDAIVPLGARFGTRRTEPSPDPFRQVAALAQRTQGRGERGVERLRLLREERRGPECVP